MHSFIPDSLIRRLTLELTPPTSPLAGSLPQLSL